jgi:hypothetical protein
VYDTDIYEVDDKGVPTYTVDDSGKVTFNKIHAIGDPIYNDDGTPLYKYRKGDPVFDENGNLILQEDRIQLYNIQAIMIDARLYVSQYPAHVTYRNKITKVLEDYFTVLRVASDNMLERDRIYFKPIQTLGYAKFNIGDGVTTTLSLAMSIHYRIHLSSDAYSDVDLRSKIEEAAISEIESSLSNKSISLTDIAKSIQSKLPYITSIDVLGISGDTDLQTLYTTDEGVQPSLEQVLYLTKDNEISIRKAANIEFVLE